jgi:2-octaprenyl-6-methoxyphenol hydroxylase
MPTEVTEVDVAIVGGGMIGASLALALEPSGLQVALIEGFAPDAVQQPSFDERTTALGNGTRSMLGSLGVWDELLPLAAPIQNIHVSDAGRFGVAQLRAAEQGLDALGYVLTNRNLGAALWRRLREQPRLARLMPARAAWSGVVDDAAELTIAAVGGSNSVTANGAKSNNADPASARQPGAWPVRLRAKLVVAADGADSAVRAAVGLESIQVDYQQVAVIANVTTSEPHSSTAFERFTPQGPIALLPLADGARGVIWAMPPAEAARSLARPEADFLRELQQVFGWRAGQFLRCGKRASYPLALQRAAESVAERCILIGNAAQALHPIAGQGFNLGMRDVALLAEVLAAVHADANAGVDCGAAAVLTAFAKARDADRDGVIRFTDALVRLFGDARPGMGTARGLGLLAFDLLPPAKDALSRLSWGWSGKRPRLIRGQGLAR